MRVTTSVLAAVFAPFCATAQAQSAHAPATRLEAVAASWDADARWEAAPRTALPAPQGCMALYVVCDCPADVADALPRTWPAQWHVGHHAEGACARQDGDGWTRWIVQVQDPGFVGVVRCDLGDGHSPIVEIAADAPASAVPLRAMYADPDTHGPCPAAPAARTPAPEEATP